MKSYGINASFKDLNLPSIEEQDATVVVPAVKGTPLLKYGEHAYYFLNLKSQKGIRVAICHKDIILPGLKGFLSANSQDHNTLPLYKALFRKYHYDFSLPEQIMLMTVPHCVTSLGNGRFFINLWSYYGYIDVDCNERTAKYVRLDDNRENHVMGSQQLFDKTTNELIYMTYSLEDSMKRASSPENSAYCRILKRNADNGKASEVWSGDFVDNMHDILINSTRQYCVVPEMGMFKDRSGKPIPSKVLIVDLNNNRSWTISRFIVAAHAQFDPQEPDIIYFSNHNFEFMHSNIIKLLKNAIYAIKFLGPASVFKYKLTPEGPVEVGEFTEPDLFRLTNFHVFMHRGHKIITAMGAPNFIYIADATTMQLIKKIEVNHTKSIKNLYRDIPCIIGTISPSIDGEKLFVQTTRTLQMVDVSSGRSDIILDHFYHHTSANHMITSTDTNW